MGRHQWAGILGRERESSRNKPEMRSENREIQGLRNPELGLRGTSSPGPRTGWIPLRGNFSFYPTLFIASQEMFVNCEFSTQSTLQVLIEFRTRHPSARLRTKRTMRGVTESSFTGANDIQSER
jgi:hypothetical protein